MERCWESGAVGQCEWPSEGEGEGGESAATFAPASAATARPGPARTASPQLAAGAAPWPDEEPGEEPGPEEGAPSPADKRASKRGRDAPAPAVDAALPRVGSRLRISRTNESTHAVRYDDGEAHDEDSRKERWEPVQGVGTVLRAMDRCGKLLDAKIVDERVDAGAVELRVHFKGWSRAQDEWIPALDDVRLRFGADSEASEAVPAAEAASTALVVAGEAEAAELTLWRECEENEEVWSEADWAAWEAAAEEEEADWAAWEEEQHEAEEEGAAANTHMRFPGTPQSEAGDEAD